MRKLFTIVTIVFIATPCFAQITDTVWARRHNTPVNQGYGAHAISVDNSRKTYLTGSSDGGATSYDYAAINYTTYLQDPDDPGVADTLYFQAGSPCSLDGDTLYFAPGGGDVTIFINIWNDEAINAMAVPLVDDAYGPPSNAFLGSVKNNGAPNPVCFQGSRVEYFDVSCNLELNPPQVLYGVFSTFDSLLPGDGLFATMVFTVSDTGRICLDTLFHPPSNDLVFVRTDLKSFVPQFVSKCFYLRPYPPPIPNFVGNPIIGEKNLDVTFMDSSEGIIDSWYWSFGDGYTSIAQNPAHTYRAAGTYNVKLIVTNQFGSDSLIRENYIQVLDKPLADFCMDSTLWPVGLKCVVGIFHDNSIGNVTYWKWYSGDGDSSAGPLGSFSHSYWDPGTYDVTMIATSANGSDTVTKKDFIYVFTDSLGGDTVKVLEMTAVPNQEDVRVPIILTAMSDSLREINIPLTFTDTSLVHIDSVSFENSRFLFISPVEDTVIAINNEQATIFIRLSTSQSPFIKRNQVAIFLGWIYLKVKDVAPNTEIVFQKTTIGSDSLLYVAWNGIEIEPGFYPGTLFVEKTESNPPEQPQNLVALPLESGVSLTWDPVTDPDLRLYAVYKDYNRDSLDDTLATTNDPFYLDLTVSPGETLFYSVSAVDSSWNESEYSDYAYVIFGDTTSPVITLGPTVIAITDSSATFYWETDEKADGYGEVYIDTNWATADSHTTFLLEHTATVTWLEPSTSYEYRVHSMDSLDNGPTYSESDILTTASGPDVTSPQIIFGPAVVYKTHNSATIEWTTNEIADGKVNYGENIPLADSVLEPGFVTSHNITLNGLSSSTEYLYTVSSKDPSGNGPTYSDTLILTTNAGPDNVPPVIVEGPIHSGITDNKAVISWITDEIATSIVQYGPSELYGSERVKSDYVQNHQIVLTNLQDSALYHYRVGSVDPESNGPTWSSNFWFWTQSAPDTVSPLILTGPYASWINNTRAQIDWTTDEVSDSWVHYGLDLSYGNIGGSPTYVTDHSVVLTNLTPDTTYYYYISSTDPSGNTVQSEHTGGGGMQPLDTGDDQFTTKATPDATPPVITSGPHIRHKTHNQAMVEWVTDETCNSIVEYGLSQEYGTLITYPEATINHTAFLSNLSPSTVYHFRVGSKDIANNGPAFSSDVTFTTSADVVDTDPPVITVPPGIAYLDETRAVITWKTDEPSNSYMSYELIGVLAERIVGESFNNFTHMLNMSLASSYNVRVFSTDAYGNGPTYSDYFTVTAPTTPDVQAPVATYGPEVVYVSENSARIKWETNELSSSSVEYGLSEEYSDFKAKPENDSLHEVTLTNLSASTTYHYRIKSADLFGNVFLGADSTFLTASSSDITPPGVPTGLSATYGNQWIRLKWNRNPEGDLSGYNLHRATALSDTTLPLIDGNLPDTAYKDQGLVNGVTYYYQITAMDMSSNVSSFSEVICSKPLSYIVGDFNGDLETDVVDVVAIVNYLFRGAEGHEPLEAGNVNCNEEITISDVVYLINYLFKGGADPCICTIPEQLLARYENRAKAIVGLCFPDEGRIKEIEVLLEAEIEEEVAGIELDLNFDPSQLEVKDISTTSRTEGLGLFHNVKQSKVKIGMVDIYGANTIMPGDGPLLKVRFFNKGKGTGINSVRIENAILVNPSAQELEVEIKPNKLVRSIPQVFSLAQNYPNPFNARTVIKYSLPQDSKVEITIYNILGQKVKMLVNEYQQAGYKTVIWDGTNQKGNSVASGVYFYKIKAGDFVQSKKMLLLK